ncbi:ParB/RepB/Spo0J family partition protein [Cellulomonas palmilytica]|uniref:ParB/RepB/Spo0J family partition protein n=1 Tax=Cellulomonas palmilytica TaxID=2608402 RepID=UPI001F44E12B|nr:ParB/RepB/Spo0J family partition protein [Cellulomonas palmilytica]UJP39352.1 ParB/RepB/Spo0J family partition protein [Cellulomonas palmilytica]
MTTTDTNAALAAALDAVAGPPVPTAPRTRTATPPQQLQRVALTELHRDPNNPRDEETEIADLAASIAQVGLLQPIIVRRDAGRLVVVCGHRRLAALRKLGWRDVDVVVRREMPADQVLVAMLAENQQRVLLDPIEEARAYSRLQAVYGFTHLQVAERVGRPQSYVSGRLALLNLSPQEQEEIRAGQRSLTRGIQIGRVKAGKVRNRAKGSGWHLSETHRLAARARARCRKLEHPRGTWLGDVACGSCWESVIRADEKDQLRQDSARRGECALCGQPSVGVRVAPGAPVVTSDAVVTR